MNIDCPPPNPNDQRYRRSRPIWLGEFLFRRVRTWWGRENSWTMSRGLISLEGKCVKTWRVLAQHQVRAFYLCRLKEIHIYFQRKWWRRSSILSLLHREERIGRGKNCIPCKKIDLLWNTCSMFFDSFGQFVSLDLN